jgi:type II secretory pathway component PulK
MTSKIVLMLSVAVLAAVAAGSPVSQGNQQIEGVEAKALGAERAVVVLGGESSSSFTQDKRKTKSEAENSGFVGSFGKKRAQGSFDSETAATGKGAKAELTLKGRAN